MTKQMNLTPPKPPKSLDRKLPKRGLFSRLLYSLGLKHEHVEDFDALIHLQNERPKGAIDEALNYEPVQNKEEDVKEFSIAIDGVDKTEKEKEEAMKKPVISSEKIVFTEEQLSPLDKGRKGQFIQDTEYDVKKLSEEFSEFQDQEKTTNNSSWSDTEESENETASSFAQDPEGVQL